MVTSIFADVTPYLRALADGKRDRAVTELIDLLGSQRVPPDKLAGRIGLAALWGSAAPQGVSAMAATGHLAEWMRNIPAGPEPQADELRQIAVALPLAQGGAAVADAVGKGMSPRDDKLPAPLLPAQVKHADGPIGALRDAFVAKDVSGAQRILLGYHATGADYRALLTTLYGALAHRYPEGGRPLIFAHAAKRILDMGDWGGNMPAFVAWVTPILCGGEPESAVSDAARDYASRYDFAWLRKRLAPSKEEAAGPTFQRAVLTGDEKAACKAVDTALRNGASARGVAAAMTLVAASQLVAVPSGDGDRLLRAAQNLRYQQAVHLSVTEVQDVRAWPLLFTAACALQASASDEGTAKQPVAAAVGTGAGTIPMAQLRTVEKKLTGGDATAALGAARRYLQMDGPRAALAGVIASAASLRDTASPDGQELTAAVEAALDAWMRLPEALARGGMNSLLTAAMRLTTDLRGENTFGEQIRGAIDAALAQTA